MVETLQIQLITQYGMEIWPQQLDDGRKLQRAASLLSRPGHHQRKVHILPTSRDAAYAEQAVHVHDLTSLEKARVLCCMPSMSKQTVHQLRLSVVHKAPHCIWRCMLYCCRAGHQK